VSPSQQLMQCVHNLHTHASYRGLVVSASQCQLVYAVSEGRQHHYYYWPTAIVDVAQVERRECIHSGMLAYTESCRSRFQTHDL